MSIYTHYQHRLVLVSNHRDATDEPSYHLSDR